MKNQIPQLAYIEAQILHAASASNLLASAVRDVEAKYGLNPQSLGTGVFLETRVLSLLYLLIVVPKEFGKLDPSHVIYKEIAESWSISNAEIKTDKSKWDNPVYSFIHFLRNAVAHTNFHFSGGAFEFWNQWKSNPEQYRARVSLEQMQLFLEVVGSTLANHVCENDAV